jgi:hypothetical protein
LDGGGVLQVWTLGGPNASELRSLAKTKWTKAIRCVTFGAATLEDRHVAAGDFQGKLTLWDLEDIAKVCYTECSYTYHQFFL